MSLGLGGHAWERLTFRANSEDGVVTEPAPGVGMSTETKRHGEFVAFEVALEIVRAMRGIVVMIRRQDAELAKQMVRAASSIAANVAEGNRRVGRDRLHLFRVAAGSADEVMAHLRVAQAWGYVTGVEVDAALKLLDRQLRLLSGLTR